MATKKKTVKKKTAKVVKMTTSATVKAELKAKGYRLPHGYDVVKRKPTAKKTTAKKTTSKKK
jgi:hypothetical protein